MVKGALGNAEYKLCPLPVPLSSLPRHHPGFKNYAHILNEHGFQPWFQSLLSRRSQTSLHYSLLCACLWLLTFVLLKFSTETNKSV